jgi:hypothetical protein
MTCVHCRIRTPKRRGLCGRCLEDPDISRRHQKQKKAPARAKCQAGACSPVRKCRPEVVARSYMKHLSNAKLVWSRRTVRARCDRCGRLAVGVDGTGCPEVSPGALELLAMLVIERLSWACRGGELLCVACDGRWCAGQVAYAGPVFVEAEASD